MSNPSEPLRRTVKIQASFGSEYQRDVSMKILRELIASWKESVEDTHRNNTVHIKEE